MKHFNLGKLGERGLFANVPRIIPGLFLQIVSQQTPHLLNLQVVIPSLFYATCILVFGTCIFMFLFRIFRFTIVY